MERSTKDAWLQGPSDLKEADVADVPVPGMSVRVRGLSARYAADVLGHVKVEVQGREQVAKIDAAAMETLQFVHGVIDPVFTEDEARQVQEKFGPAFRRVIQKIDELSDIDKEAVESAQARFPAGNGSQAGSDMGHGPSAGSSESDVHV